MRHTPDAKSLLIRGDLLHTNALLATPYRRRGQGEPRVAIIHYWLVGMRGGEKVLESLLKLFPQAEIFTHAYDPKSVSPLIRSKKVHLTSVGRLPFSTRLYQKYLPLMPRALEELDLSGFDLVLSSEAGPAKGVIAPPDSPHICYTHSPMRYIWDQYHVYRNGAGILSRTMMPHMAHRLRQWDVSSASRVDHFVANSRHVAHRIEKYWRRHATVVHPPVEVDAFKPVALDELGGFYLWVGELAPYKRPDLAVEAFTRMNKPLFVIGGPAKTEARLQEAAGENVVFLGKVSTEKLRNYMAHCQALIFPGEEDFGIVPVEAMAAGRPVIAYGRGGALDTVIDRETGLLYYDQSVEGIIEAVEAFEAENLGQLDPLALAAHATRFDETSFLRGICEVIEDHGIQVLGRHVRRD